MHIRMKKHCIPWIFLIFCFCLKIFGTFCSNLPSRGKFLSIFFIIFFFYYNQNDYFINRWFSLNYSAKIMKRFWEKCWEKKMVMTVFLIWFEQYKVPQRSVKRMEEENMLYDSDQYLTIQMKMWSLTVHWSSIESFCDTRELSYLRNHIMCTYLYT